ncbi:MAG: DUF4355 domain-containing protein [Candidatus Methanomethylophilaceae archaeon]|nr:DUF4355 domain-containing protein [Candidatus Methanomethylophilaceae archaeon]
MATEGETSEQVTGTDPIETSTEPKTFTYTQEQLNAIIESRLNRERAKLEKERHDAEAERAEAERIAKLEGEERIKAEYEGKLSKATKERDDITKQLRLTEARSELASAGLDQALAERIVGKTLEETKANVDAIKQAVEAEATKRVNAQAAKGNPGNPTGSGSGSTSVLDIMMRGAGLK